MNLADLLTTNWDIIVANPVFFITTGLVFSGLGFYVGRLVYGTITDIVKERLEAARDDAARLERAKREESETVARLQDELAKCLQGHKLAVHASLQQAKPTTFANNQDNSSNSATAAGADSFFLSIPHRSLEDALDEARKTKKLVFAVIYDETNPHISKLIYSLSHFMEYHTTKKLVDEYFTTAIVKASNEKAASLVPDNDPLENCLWVVMTPTGEILTREGVYANPDEGLKRVRAAIASAGKL